MNTYEIMSTVRSFTGLDTETELGTPVLKRMMNLGVQTVAQLFMPLYHEFLVKTKPYTGESGVSVEIPMDLLRILDVERKDSADIFRGTAEVPVEDKSQVGKNVNYTPSEEYPLYVHEGKDLLVWPTLSTTDVNLRYRKRVIDLIDGTFTYASATPGTLGADALPEDHYYNDYMLAVYTVSSEEVALIGTYRITDYVGSTKVVTLSGPTLTDVSMRYALVPLLPAEFHNQIIEAAIINLKRTPKYFAKIGGASWGEDLAVLKAGIADLLQVNTGRWPIRVGEVK